MACASQMYRLDYKKALHFAFSSDWEKRVHNGGVLLQRPERDFLVSRFSLLENCIVKIPCGKCIQCRLSYARDWANRIMLEAKEWEHNYFLTLTYDDAHLNFASHFDVETGELDTRPVLVKKDFQDFMKRLRTGFERNYCCTNVRFYACGEYGDLTARPHYHVILFNAPFQDLRYSPRFSKEECALFESQFLMDTWGKGHCVVGDVTWESAAYTARYIMKKQIGKSKKLRDEFMVQLSDFDELFIDGWLDEFVLMSRKPGIARNYYDKHRDEIYQNDELFVKQHGKVMSVKPPAYYDRLFDIEYPDTMQLIKQRRQVEAKRMMADILSRTDLTEEEYLLMKERSKEEQAKKLIRPLD